MVEYIQLLGRSVAVRVRVRVRAVAAAGARAGVGRQVARVHRQALAAIQTARQSRLA